MTMTTVIVVPTNWIERSNCDFKIVRRILVEVIDLYEVQPGKKKNRPPIKPTYQPRKESHEPHQLT